MDGVPGTGSPVLLNFLDVGGSKTGKLFPTGNVRDQVEGVEVSCLDAAVPMVHINAKDFGLAGNETKQQLDDNAELLERIESIRLSAGRLMGMGDVTGSVVPKVSLLSPPTQDGHITSRYFVPQNCHASHAVTGGICVAAACMIPGTVAHEVCQGINSETVVIEHPSGQIQVNIKVEPGKLSLRFVKRLWCVQRVHCSKVRFTRRFNLKLLLCVFIIAGHLVGDFFHSHIHTHTHILCSF
ncbi:hypothetical protein O9853_24320 [Vibrio lentus]|nr:hypothetical protein [Vibrio lentus]